MYVPKVLVPTVPTELVKRKMTSSKQLYNCHMSPLCSWQLINTVAAPQWSGTTVHEHQHDKILALQDMQTSIGACYPTPSQVERYA